MLTDISVNLNSPSGTGPENGNALLCWVVEFYFSGSSAPPEPHEASPYTLRTYLVTLAAGGQEKEDQERREGKKLRKKQTMSCEQTVLQHECVVLFSSWI